MREHSSRSRTGLVRVCGGRILYPWTFCPEEGPFLHLPLEPSPRSAASVELGLLRC